MSLILLPVLISIFLFSATSANPLRVFLRLDREMVVDSFDPKAATKTEDALERDRNPGELVRLCPSVPTEGRRECPEAMSDNRYYVKR